MTLRNPSWHRIAERQRVGETLRRTLPAKRAKFFSAEERTKKRGKKEGNHPLSLFKEDMK